VFNAAVWRGMPGLGRSQEVYIFATHQFFYTCMQGLAAGAALQLLLHGKQEGDHFYREHYFIYDMLSVWQAMDSVQLYMHLIKTTQSC
jgi:hypothetical protein